MPTGAVEFHFDELEYEGLSFGRSSLELQADADAAVTLRFDSDSVTVDEHAFASVTLTCPAHWAQDAITCSNGRISMTHAELGPISGRAAFRYHFEHGLQHAAISHVALADGRADIELRRIAGDWRIDVALDDVDLAALQTLVDQFGDLPALIELTPLDGRLSAGLIMTGMGDITRLQADWTLQDLNYAGDSVFQGIALEGALTAERRRDVWQLELDLQVAEGEMYVVPPLEFTGIPPGIYVEVPHGGLELAITAAVRPDLQRIGIDRLHYDHPGVLTVEAAALLEPATDSPVTALTVHVPAGDMAAAFPIYLQPWLLDTIYNDLDVAGRAGLSLEIADGHLAALAVLLDGVTVIDNAGRFALHDVSSNLSVDQERAGHSTMRWQGVDLYKLNFGPGAIGIASDGLDLTVTDWQDVPIFDGLLRIAQLDISGLGAPDFGLDMAGELVPVSLLTLTEALEWPPFGGTLGGEFAGLSYRNGDLEVAGQLRVRMFDGEVVISGLRVQDLLGRLPILEAEVAVTAIDLEQLTDTFAFGKITGRLSGRVDDLRLENWQPVTFDAELSTVADRRTRHRISQQALNNIGQIGGGLQGALSRGFLRYFDEYSYGDLGISCRLASGYCQLAGVKETDDGYYILTRGGLLPPWVEVRLVGTIVPWETLIEGFRTIAAGDIVIE